MSNGSRRNGGGAMTEAEKLDRVRSKRSIDPEPDIARRQSPCGTAVLMDLGCAVPAEHFTGSMNEIRAALEADGRAVERMWGTFDAMACPTLSQFIRENPTGTFVMMTGATGEPHTMALREGMLTDTDLTGTGRRRLNVVYKVA